MFDKFKQLNELRKMRSQAMALQKELEQITETMEEWGWKVTVTGDGKIASITGEGDTDQLVELINKALKEVQKKAAKKMMEMGGGLSGLLGGQ